MMDEFCLEHPDNHFCNRRARLVPLERDSSRYLEIRDLFERGWKHPSKHLPYLHSVFKVIAPEANVKPFLTYQSSVLTTSWWSPFVRAGTEALLFHGTTRACLFGETPQSVLPCKLSGCSLCAIVRDSFDVNKCGNKHKFSRFGKGIYTSSCSSKADDYVRNLSKRAKHRVLLLNRVALGRTYRLKRNAQHLTAPPSGYHSVLGEPGIDLNYEETVVYSNDAIRPGYLLVYGDPPEEETEKRGLRNSLRKIFTTPILS
ncbi:ADP-ribosylation [Panus rudis PR-1116 ss-1]|nr:ADP-ribosylation [Panus rudis PR-1116 ss-1]